MGKYLKLTSYHRPFNKEKTSTFLLAWNPNKYKWSGINEAIKDYIVTGKFVGRWSCGNTKRILPGDRVFLIRQSKEPRGIFASGYAVSRCIQDKHWDKEKAKKGKLANYINVNFDVLLNPLTDRILTRPELNEGILEVMNWSAMASGITIPENIAKGLEFKWAEITGYNLEDAIPEEVDKKAVVKEGAVKIISINAYERNPIAREKCIQRYGYRCIACGLSMEKIYGERALEFIHIHHIVPLADISEEYEVDGYEDLRPLCPNCHAVIHRFKPALTIEELVKILHN